MREDVLFSAINFSFYASIYWLVPVSKRIWSISFPSKSDFFPIPICIAKAFQFWNVAVHISVDKDELFFEFRFSFSMGHETPHKSALLAKTSNSSQMIFKSEIVSSLATVSRMNDLYTPQLLFASIKQQPKNHTKNERYNDLHVYALWLQVCVSIRIRQDKNHTHKNEWYQCGNVFVEKRRQAWRDRDSI